MAEPLQSGSERSNLTDKEIIAGLKEATGNQLTCLETLFYKRYVNYIHRGAMIKYKDFNDPENLATEITQQTFINAFRGIKDFSFPATASVKDYEYIIKGWLGKIANRCFLKIYGNGKKEIFIEPELLENIPGTFESPYADVREEVSNEFMSKLQEALATIKNEAHKHILLTYAGEGCIDSNLHLSSQAMDILCDTHKTTPENIRQIKKRTLDKIKNFCYSTNQ